MVSRLPGGIKKNCLIFLSYCPSQIRPMKFCNHDNSKIVIARSFKFGQLIQNVEASNLR